MIYGLIGLGNMGIHMAANIAAAGMELMVYDIRSERAQELGGPATPARSVREIAERCDVIALVVRDDAQVDEVLVGSGGDGVLHHARPHSTVVVHSTVQPTTCTRLADVAAGRSIAFGGARGARDGTLAVIVGGDADSVARCAPLFDAIGSQTFHVGGVGMGSAAKLVNNHVSLVSHQALREGLALAKAFGIDLRVQLAVICSGAADSWGARNWDITQQQMVNYPTGGPEGLAELAYKDLQLVILLSHSVGAHAPLAALTSQLVTDLSRPFAYGSAESIELR